MTKNIVITVIVFGGLWWVLVAGAAEQSTYSATQPSTSPAKELVLDLGNKVTMKLALIPSGKFTMGSPAGEKDREDDEGPQHEVTISKPFYMSVYEVTQEQYEQIVGKNPSEFKGAKNPVETVSWDDAVDFCKRLSQKTGKTVRLPTEAEWEYACRAGTKTKYSFGDGEDKLGNYTWYPKSSKYEAHQAGQKKHNAWGLYDMHGNLEEWCADWYDENYYANAKNTDPQGPESGIFRVLRGGNWVKEPQSCRSAARRKFVPDIQMAAEFFRGFRVVVELKHDQNALATATVEWVTQPTSQPSTKPAIQTSTQPAKELTLDLGNTVTMKLVLIPSGKFIMGSPKDEKDRWGHDEEGPQHEVTISKPFYMAVYPVTQKQYEQIMGNNTSHKKGPQNPVENVSWNDAVEFCKALSKNTGATVSLPTEAQWEYACRAGSTTRFYYGDDNDYSELGDYAWYAKNSGGDIQTVGQKKPNNWGLYDMHGNVWQWCSDWYDDDYYANSPKTDPKGPASGTAHVVRGGSYHNNPQFCRLARRFEYYPDSRGGNVGFRVVVEVPAGQSGLR